MSTKTGSLLASAAALLALNQQENAVSGQIPPK